MLQLKDVGAAYGKVQVLRNITMEVKEGELVALIGANGAGKTTLLRTISRTVTLTEGEINFRSKSVNSLKASHIVRIGVAHVPEGRRIFAPLTVTENLIMGGYSRKDKTSFVGDIKKVFSYFPRLEERKFQKAGTLSGGEQQMLAIGRGLMASPSLLLLDEPSLGLAPIVVEEIVKIINEIRQAGVSILLVEQNANLALKISDRGYVLENGLIAMEGPSHKLHQSEHVKNFYLGG